MSYLQPYVRQVNPRNETYTPPIDKIQKYFDESVAKLPQDKELDVDSLVSAEDSNIATAMYETAAVMIAMEGLKLNKSKFETVMKHNEIDSIAKKWIKDFLNIHSNKEAFDALLDWFIFIGGATVDVHNGVFKDFIHKSIGDYYKSSPITFQVQAAEKPNTADVILITSGTRQDVFNAFSTISKLADKDQASRVKTTKKGLVTLLDEKGKEIVSYYQISLKKSFEKARIGRATTFINKNYLGGISSGSPTQAADWAAKQGIADYELQTDEFIDEGFFGDIFSKFTDIVSGGFKNFVGWVKKKYIKVAQVLVGVAVKLSNQMIKKDRGMKSIIKVVSTTKLNESTLTSFLGEKKSPEITVTKTLLKEFKTIENEFIKKDKINKIHRENVALLEKLNFSFTAPGRKVVPILLLPDAGAGIVDMTTISNEVDYVITSEEGDTITKDDIFVALKIGMNFSANVAILAILKSIERNISQYENLSQALFAFSAEIESEVKFGNTSLPLVIVYGGEDKKAIVLGTRSDYKQDKTIELSQKGRDYNDFPVAIISVRKAKAGKTQQLYNVIHFKIVTDFKEVDGKPEPIYLMFELIADQSRSFTLKIEGNKYQDKIKAMS